MIHTQKIQLLFCTRTSTTMNNGNNNNGPGSPGDYNINVNNTPNQPPVSLEEIVLADLKNRFDAKQEKIEDLLMEIGEMLSCRGRQFQNDAAITLQDLKFVEKVLNEATKVLAYIMRTCRYEGAQEHGLNRNFWFKVDDKPIGDLLLACHQHTELVAINTGMLFQEIKNILNESRSGN